MTTTLDPRFAPATDHRPTTPRRRMAAFARAEARLLGRNRVALATGLLLGPLMAGMFVLVNLGSAQPGSGSFTPHVIAIVLTWSALLTVYYNLTSIFVARREDRVFKRLATGEATSWEVLVAASVPSSLILLAHLVLGSGVAILGFGVPAAPNPLLVVPALAGTVVVCVGLAAASTAFTSSVEAAQYSTMPVFLLLSLTSGTMFPQAMLPEPMQALAALTPLNAASELLSIGLGGTTLVGERVDGLAAGLAAAGSPLLVLAAWCVLAAWLARRYMQFEPRR